MDAQDKKLALQALNRIDGSIQTLRKLFGDQTQQTGPSSDKQPKLKTKAAGASEFETAKAPEAPKKEKSKGVHKFYASSLPADQLGETPDFTNNDWPIAIDPALIVPSDGDTEKQYRALQIVGLMQTPLMNMNVLDCGCGEGYNAREMANTATKVVGYDIKQDDRWSGRSKENLILTNDKALVAEHAPFDLIVLYDVIDHLQGEDPEPFLTWIASLLNNGGQVFARTHPWTAKTGGHFYEVVNKAWIHLALTSDELARAGLKAKEPNIRAVRPMAAYEEWFKNAGLTVKDKTVKSDRVDEFFLQSGLIERIIKITWNGSIDVDTAKMIMSNQWVDYHLKK